MNMMGVELKRPLLACAGLAFALALGACGEETPTSTDPDRMPIEARTVELILPWEVFGRNVTVYGGFGSPNDLASVVLARDYEGGLNSRGLLKLTPFPTSTSVRDSTGTTVTDSVLTYFGGRLVVRLDTIASTAENPVELALHALDQDWHAPTASWEFAVDTVGNRRPWQEPGAGPARLLSTATWDPAAGDSVVFEIDSAQIAAWADTAAVLRSGRLDLETAGERIEVVDARIRLDTRPSVAKDTTFVLTALTSERTFIYTPFVQPPPDGIRVGGAPAWRTVLKLDLPQVITGPAEVCAAVGCPFRIEPDRINQASLVLTSAQVTPEAFQPSDSIRIDVRPVLAPERLPKAPLGGSFLGVLGRAVAPAAFGVDAGQEIGIPITSFIRTAVSDGEDVPRPLALLSVFEPLSIAFGSFVGPGSAGEPRLRLIVTVADTVEIR